MEAQGFGQFPDGALVNCLMVAQSSNAVEAGCEKEGGKLVAEAKPVYQQVANS
jgi:hypothetical protein